MTEAPGTQPRGAELTIVARDGVRLGARLYESSGTESLGSVVVSGAIGVAQGRYAELATFLSRAGWNVVTFDYRGLGASRGSPAEFARHTMIEWGRCDLDAVLHWARASLPGPRRVMIGHSIGGQLLGLTDEHRYLDAAAMVAVQRGYWGLWRGPFRYGLRAFWYAVPLVVRILGLLPLHLVGLEDLPPRAALDWARWGRHDEYFSATGEALGSRFGDLRFPMLAISVEDDTTYAPRESVDWLYRKYYCNAPFVRLHVELAHFALRELGHSGFFRSSAAPEIWWRELCDWLALSEGENLRAGLLEATELSLSRAFVGTRQGAAATLRHEVQHVS